MLLLVGALSLSHTHTHTGAGFHAELYIYTHFHRESKTLGGSMENRSGYTKGTQRPAKKCARRRA
jgi:hypothetical protein